MKTQSCCRPRLRWSLSSGRSVVVAVVSAFVVMNFATGQRLGNPTPGSLDMGNNDNLRPADFASNPFPNQFPGANFQDPFDTNVFRTTEDPSRTTSAPTTPTPFRRTQQEINRYLNKETLSSFPEAPFNPNQGELFPFSALTSCFCRPEPPPDLSGPLNGLQTLVEAVPILRKPKFLLMTLLLNHCLGNPTTWIYNLLTS